MCDFFSFCMDEYGKKYYFDWPQRQKLIAEGNAEACDSHSHIAVYYGKNEDDLSKYEYNPLTHEFAINEISVIDNSVQAERWVQKLNFRKIVAPFVIKPIINPFDLPKTYPTSAQQKLLFQWASVGDSVRDSAWASVRDSVRASVGASVWASVRDSVWDSVRASVWAYISSFFAIRYDYDFSPAIQLWETSLVPSFDGKTWRLHSGKNAKIVFEWQP